MSVKLWELESLIGDARDLLERASEMAVEASGYVRPVPFGDSPDPGEPGWQAMLDLSDVLGKLAEQVRTCIPEEIVEAIKGEAAYLDELGDRADAASY